MKKQNKTPSEIHKNHRSRMKATYLKSGLSNFSDIEKLEFILYYGISRKDTNPIAHKLLDEYKTFDKVLEAPIEDLKNIEGLGEHSAILLHLFLQVINEYGKNKCSTYIPSTSIAKEFAANLYHGVNVEEFYIVCLNTANKVLQVKKINSGTASEVNVQIKDLTKLAINNNCERIIIIHNHPHGLAKPSDEDIFFTAQITFSCILLDIEVIDHIIVGPDKQFSFEESGILKELKKDGIRKHNKSYKFGASSTNYTID